MGGPSKHASCLVADSTGFTGLGALSLPGFPISPLPGRHASSNLISGAYPLCHPPNVWSPGPGPCYWLVASGLARRLPSRGAGVWGRCPTTALAGAVPCLCARGARGRGWGRCRLVVFPPSLSSCVPRGFRCGCGGLFPPGFPCPRSMVHHSMWSVRSAVVVRWPFRFVPFVCWGALSRCPRSCCPAPACPPPLFPMRALRGVPSQGDGRAVPCGSCPSVFPARVRALCARRAEGCLCSGTCPLLPCSGVPVIRHSPSFALLRGACAQAHPLFRLVEGCLCSGTHPLLPC